MDLVWNIAASALMICLMIVLAWRGILQLCRHPDNARDKHVAVQAEKPHLPQGSAAAKWWEYALWAVGALAAEYIMIYLAWCLVGCPDAFLPYFWKRFTTAGDASHYLYLARFGYAATGGKMNLIVFYPLYPIAIRILYVFTRNYAAAAVILSQSCWALSAVLLRRIAGRLTKSAGAARCAVLAVILFPFSFFSMGIYTESLFLLLTLGALEAALTRKWQRGGVLGFAAALCRTQGVLLLLPLVFAWLASHPLRGGKWHEKQVVWLAGPLVGYGLYLWLNRLYCGSATAFLAYQEAAPWYQSAQWVGATIGQQWYMINAYEGLALFIYIPQTVLYFAAVLLFLYAAHRGAPEEILLYGGAYIGASYLSTWLISGSRYVFGCAALYLAVPYLKKAWMRGLLLAAEAVGCVFYFAFYMQGQAIM